MKKLSWKELDLMTEKQIVKALRERGIKGIRGEGAWLACPLAVATGENFKEWTQIVEYDRRRSLGKPVKHTRAERLFIKHFDEGKYPDLDLANESKSE